MVHVYRLAQVAPRPRDFQSRIRCEYEIACGVGFACQGQLTNGWAIPSKPACEHEQRPSVPLGLVQQPFFAKPSARVVDDRRTEQPDSCWATATLQRSFAELHSASSADDRPTARPAVSGSQRHLPFWVASRSVSLEGERPEAQR